MKPVRRICPVIVLLALTSVPALAGDNCTHKTWNWKVDKKAAMELQQFVNDGHEPWRMDNVATIAGQAIDDRRKDWDDESTIFEAPKVISETENVARLDARSEDSRVRYEITLRKYSWLLPSAKENWNWVIWLPASVERTGCRSLGNESTR